MKRQRIAGNSRKTQGETKQKHPFNLSDEKAERLAAATLEFYHWFIEQPGGREKLEARKAELRKRGLI
jgi:hypothetical protein